MRNNLACSGGIIQYISSFSCQNNTEREGRIPNRKERASSCLKVERIPKDPTEKVDLYAIAEEA